MDLNAENSYGEVDPAISHTTLSPSPARHAHGATPVSGTFAIGPGSRSDGLTGN